MSQPTPDELSESIAADLGSLSEAYRLRSQLQAEHDAKLERYQADTNILNEAQIAVLQQKVRQLNADVSRYRDALAERDELISGMTDDGMIWS